MARYEVDDDGIPGLTLALRLRLKGHQVALAPSGARVELDQTFTLPAPYRDLLLKSGVALEDATPLRAAPGRRFTIDGHVIELPHVGPHSGAIGEALGAPAGRQWAALIRVAADTWGTLRTGTHVSRRSLSALMRDELRDRRLRQLLEAYLEPHGLAAASIGDAAVVLPYLDQTFGRWQFGHGLASLEAELRTRCARLGVATQPNAGEYLSLDSYWTAQFAAPKPWWRSGEVDSLSTAGLGLPWVGMAADFIADRIGRA